MVFPICYPLLPRYIDERMDGAEYLGVIVRESDNNQHPIQNYQNMAV